MSSREQIARVVEGLLEKPNSIRYGEMLDEWLERSLPDALAQLIADAQAEALRSAARGVLTNDPLDYWDQHLPKGLGWQDAMSRWLRAHAEAIDPAGGAE